MSLQDRLKPFLKVLKVVSVCGSSVFVIAYHLRQTFNRIEKIVNPNVIDLEKKTISEYIYIDDPSYDAAMKQQTHNETKQSVGLARVWKSFKRSLASKLLWLCRHGTKEQRDLAIEQLAAFKNNKVWDCYKLAQALDKDTAVLLARTEGADVRYFLPPPIHIRRAALTSEFLSFKIKDMIHTVQNINPHSCIHYFLQKYFMNLLDQGVEVDSIPTKPDNLSEKDLCLLCLDALYHHLQLFHQKSYENDVSTSTLIKLGILEKLAEAMLRYKNDVDVDLAVLRVLTVLSVHSNLLSNFFENGLLRELTRLIKSRDIRLQSTAAVCLANLSGEYCYRPGLYLLYPIYRTRTSHTCDTLLVHGLRGGVFVTWRQRDKKCAEPTGIIELTVSNSECDDCQEKPTQNKFLDPELQQVMEDLMEMEDEALLSSMEVVLQDIPTKSNRELTRGDNLTANKKRTALIQEEEDKCTYTHCWPKDWLPKDCKNLRILGVNYWSSLSDWLERCPLQNSDLCSKAANLSSILVDAGVGINDIVWLAHSMGGLIVKQLLVDLAQSDETSRQELCKNTKAILFYSTPHKGSSLATMPRAAAAVLWPSQDVRQLQENSPELLNLHKSFIKYADIFNWETISFSETLPTLITTFKVPVHFVEPFSADLGRGVFYQLPLDHLTICKPATRQSILYTTVLDILLQITTKDNELKYSIPFIQQWIGTVWLLLRRKLKEVIEILDDSQNTDTLWLEEVLINAFTDDFTIES